MVNLIILSRIEWYHNLLIVERRRRWKSDTNRFVIVNWEVSPGKFCNGDTNWINDRFVQDVSVRFSINRPVRSHLVGREEFKCKSFVQN